MSSSSCSSSKRILIRSLVWSVSISAKHSLFVFDLLCVCVGIPTMALGMKIEGRRHRNFRPSAQFIIAAIYCSSESQDYKANILDIQYSIHY